MYFFIIFTLFNTAFIHRVPACPRRGATNSAGAGASGPSSPTMVGETVIPRSRPLYRTPSGTTHPRTLTTITANAEEVAVVVTGGVAGGAIISAAEAAVSVTENAMIISLPAAGAIMIQRTTIGALRTVAEIRGALTDGAVRVKIMVARETVSGMETVSLKGSLVESRW